jgi:RecB family exonuclease
MKSYRQSLLASFEQCPRRAMHGMAIDDDLSVGNVGASADLGSAFHAFAAEYLRTLWRQGEKQMPTQEAIEIMYEVLAAGPWVLPVNERDDLRSMVLNFASYYEWNARGILPAGTDFDPDPAARLTAEVVCPDGEIRVVTGKPDLIVSDPPDGVVIVDFKTGWAIPRSPRQMPEKGEAIVGKEYLSERGHFQLDIYGLLAMRHYPQARRATLRELHLRTGERREASLGRDELEHVEREVGDHLMKLERAETEGHEGHELWRPRPGRQCLRRCPVLASCPIPNEQKGIGALVDEATADTAAERFIVVDGLRQTLRDQIKAYHEETGHAPDVGDGHVMRWKTDPETGRRSFGVWEPEGPPPPDDTDYEALLQASVEQANTERTT